MRRVGTSSFILGSCGVIHTTTPIDNLNRKLLSLDQLLLDLLLTFIFLGLCFILVDGGL
jgi:hypothetical protein